MSIEERMMGFDQFAVEKRLSDIYGIEPQTTKQVIQAICEELQPTAMEADKLENILYGVAAKANRYEEEN